MSKKSIVRDKFIKMVDEFQKDKRLTEYDMFELCKDYIAYNYSSDESVYNKKWKENDTSWTDSWWNQIWKNDKRN